MPGPNYGAPECIKKQAVDGWLCRAMYFTHSFTCLWIAEGIKSMY